MKITLKNTPEQVELIKAMASRDRNVAYEAQTALAEFIGPVLAEVINQAPALSNLFTTLQYNSDDNPSIPLDLYFDIADEDYVQVYSQSRAGGLPTSEVLPTSAELKVTTYSIDSAVSFDRRYAAKSRMDVVAKTMTRVAQEILLKQNTISAQVILKALAAAETNGLKHVFSAAVDDRFVLADLNAVTDIICAPEIVEELRSIAYNPINTKSAPAGPSGGDSVPTPDFIAQQAFNAAGAPEFYGIGIIELNELGGFGTNTDEKFDKIFAQHAGATQYARADGTSTSAEQFTAAADSLIIGIDRTRESLVRPVAVDAENGAEFNLIADDQYSIRQSKIGYFGSLEEGRIVLDDRALSGIIVQS